MRGQEKVSQSKIRTRSICWDLEQTIYLLALISVCLALSETEILLDAIPSITALKTSDSN